MRGTIIAGCCLLVSALPAAAQSTVWGQPGSFLTGSSQPITTIPLDLSRSDPYATQQLPRSHGFGFFSLRSFYPKISLGPWPPRFLQTPVAEPNITQTRMVPGTPYPGGGRFPNEAMIQLPMNQTK